MAGIVSEHVKRVCVCVWRACVRVCAFDCVFEYVRFNTVRSLLACTHFVRMEGKKNAAQHIVIFLREYFPRRMDVCVCVCVPACLCLPCVRELVNIREVFKMIACKWRNMEQLRRVLFAHAHTHTLARARSHRAQVCDERFSFAVRHFSRYARTHIHTQQDIFAPAKTRLAGYC